MAGITIRGREGELRWGYYQAAVLGPWTITDGALSARVVRCDAARAAQSALTFRVAREGAAAWVWPVEAVEIADGALTARIVPQKA